MLNRNHVLRTLMGASLWCAAGCQSDAFVSHEGTVRSGTSVPLSLQVHFGPDSPESRDGQMVACIALPSGWQAPGGTYTYAGAAPVAAQAAEAELVSEAQSAWPVSGAAWHCLVSDRLTTGTESVLATAQLSLAVPSVAQGPYRVRYQSGFRNAGPPRARVRRRPISPRTSRGGWSGCSTSTWPPPPPSTIGIQAPRQAPR